MPLIKIHPCNNIYNNADEIAISGHSKSTIFIPSNEWSCSYEHVSCNMTKHPFDISKFDGSLGDDTYIHVMTFHLTCFFNSLVDHRYRLCLFEWSLTRRAVKWYIVLPSSKFMHFSSLYMVLLGHFQLPIYYEMSIFKKNFYGNPVLLI